MQWESAMVVNIEAEISDGIVKVVRCIVVFTSEGQMDHGIK